ncbi:MAG: presenilin family intramembrane aspartyl protease [Thermoproteota archaeon]
MGDEFKAKLVHLTPIMASLLFGLICASLLYTSPITPPDITPLPEENLGPVFNATYFVALVAVGATVIYLLLKWKSHTLIKIITGFSITTVTFILSLLYLTAALPLSPTLLLLPSLIITILTSYTIFRVRGPSNTLVVLGLGGGLGTFMAASIPTISAVIILCFLAVYDVIAVYRGPVGKIAQTGLEKLPGLSFSFKDLTMGLGDLVFYSLLSGHMLLNFSLAASIAAIIGILAGCLLAFKMLERRGMFPGLPFPLFFGLLSGFLIVFLTP